MWVGGEREVYMGDQQSGVSCAHNAGHSPKTGVPRGGNLRRKDGGPRHS